MAKTFGRGESRSPSYLGWKKKKIWGGRCCWEGNTKHRRELRGLLEGGKRRTRTECWETLKGDKLTGTGSWIFRGEICVRKFHGKTPWGVRTGVPKVTFEPVKGVVSLLLWSPWGGALFL